MGNRSLDFWGGKIKLIPSFCNNNIGPHINVPVLPFFFPQKVWTMPWKYVFLKPNEHNISKFIRRSFHLSLYSAELGSLGFKNVKPSAEPRALSKHFFRPKKLKLNSKLTFLGFFEAARPGLSGIWGFLTPLVWLKFKIFSE